MKQREWLTEKQRTNSLFFGECCLQQNELIATIFMESSIIVLFSGWREDADQDDNSNNNSEKKKKVEKAVEKWKNKNQITYQW